MKPSYREIYRAVQRAADHATGIAIMMACGEMVGPKPSDIAAGAIDPVREAECLTAAALELASLVAVLDGNENVRRRKAG